ncbi:MAG: Ig-like domain-containing protein [Opitutus sp.]|nr:Ig-like domain-containing protein [Opitutus sp.]
MRNPRVVFSCAHVVYKEENVDPWLSKVKWHRAWSSGQFPASTTGQTLRSYYYFVGYSSAVKNYGTTSSTAFANDFVVHYAYEDTGSGGYAGWWTDGTSQLKSGVRQKLITGYPSGLYGSSHSWKYLMHETGPFYDAFSTVMDTYLRTTGVSTAQGNSGGPVWVWDSTNGQYYYAGVLISGLTRSLGESDDVVGVYGVDDTSKTLIEAAIAEVTDLMPVITQQPSSRRVTEGSDATFSVKATGGKLSYLWYMDGPFGPQMLLAETKATLTLKSVKASDAGTYYVVVTGADGTKVTSKKATLTVDPPNTAPVVSKIKNYTIDEDTPLTIKFTIRDTETSASKLKVTRSSGDTKLFPLANLKLGGSGTNRTLKLTPAKNLSGKAKIKVKASDGSLSHTRSFTVTVQAVNDPPTLGALEDITIKEDTSKTITLKIGDAETSASKLKVSVATSNTTLTPKKALVLGGSGSKRTLKITPAKNRYGSANITVTVSDGKVTKKRTFKLTVKSVNDAPTLSKIAAQTVKRNKSTPKILSRSATPRPPRGNSFSCAAAPTQSCCRCPASS